VGARERNLLERLLFADAIATLPAERVIVVDETSTHRDMYPIYARAPKGQRAWATAKRNYGHNVSLIASLSLQGTGPALAIEGAVNAATFLVFIRELLVPTLRAGDIVLMDNLSCHKTDAVRLAIEAVGAQVLFLPPYSPDFSPIEQAFSKLKAGLRSLRPPSLPDLLTALAQTLDSISVNDALGFFCSAGFLNIP
jgi:transposase